LLIRLPPGTRERIAAQRLAGEQLADAQRRVVAAGLAAIEAAPSENLVQKPAADVPDGACQIETGRLREAVARSIVQADEQNGGPPWEHLMTQGRHVVGPVYDRADAAINAMEAHRATYR
jgi:hypothetical protein